ncbi:NADH-ubiquinone oxidoreductase chain 1, partial [Galemys pyrenaicus]
YHLHMYHYINPSPQFGSNNTNSITHVIAINQHKPRCTIYISHVDPGHIFYALVSYINKWTNTLNINHNSRIFIIFPSGPLTVITWYVSTLAETNQALVDLTELISGFSAEYVTGPLSLFFLVDCANIIIKFFIAILFLGAFHNPHMPNARSILLSKPFP